jgi:uncharacterized protein YutE (UPF0331/DUF86 family)
MYFVDRDKIQEVLKFLEKQIDLFERTEKWESDIELAALERISHTMIEAILDVGNDMIDGFIMRDPGSYEDIIDILTDEKVITKEMCDGLKKLIAYRKMLVQQYIAVVHEKLRDDFTEVLPVLKQFAPSVRTYLQNELGPVSAFK